MEKKSLNGVGAGKRKANRESREGSADSAQPQAKPADTRKLAIAKLATAKLTTAKLVTLKKMGR